MSRESSSLADEFTRFSSIAHHEPAYEPYPWQIRLAEQVVRSGRWPDRVVAPTGAGKTSVVDVHLFAQTLAGLDAGAAAPRRLALIVNRRALVDSQYEYALKLVSTVVDAALAGDSEAQRYVTGWQRRSGVREINEAGTEDPLDPGVQIANLRGGQSNKDSRQSSWRQYPDKISVLSFTPEMFGSRLLFRGYGVSRGGLPIEAGLLAYDTVAIVDEAHLSQQLTLTAQQVRRIEQSAEDPLPLQPLQTVLATATPQPVEHADDSFTEIQVTEEDLAFSSRLAARLRTPKPLTLTELSSGLNEKTGLTEFVKAAIELRTHVGGTVGVVVNTVAAAQEVSARLRDSNPLGDVVTLVGRLRTFDRTRIQTRYSGLFSVEGNTEVAYVVGTQTLEVGLDIGFSGLVSELAPGDALAQRAGRVNRFATYEQGPIVVAVPPKEYRDPTSREGRRARSIYSGEDLELSLNWLRAIEVEFPEEGLSPWVIKEQADQLPLTTPRRDVFQRIEWWDLENLSASREVTAADQQLGVVGPTTLDAWLRDDFNGVKTAAVAVRGDLPQSDGLAAQLLSLTPVFEEETAEIPIGQLYAFAKRNGDSESIPTGDEALYPVDTDSDELKTTDPSRGSSKANPSRAFVIHPGERPVPVTEATAFDEGDTVILTTDTAAFHGNVFTPNGHDTLDDVLDEVLASRAALQRVRAERQGRTSQDSALPVQWIVRISVPVRGTSLGDEQTLKRIDDLSRDDLWELAGALRLLQLKAVENAEKATSNDENDDAERLRIFVTWLSAHPLSEPDETAGPSLGLSGSSLNDLRRLAGGTVEQRATLDHIITHGKATVEYLGGDDEDDEYTVLFTSHVSPGDDDFAQVSTPSDAPVLLTDHQRDVGARAKEIAGRLDLGAWADILETAGLLHDEGKKDSRFQRLLGYGRLPKTPWAKSRIRSRSFEVAFRKRENLDGWRHEQRSAVEAWTQLADRPAREREVITRLVGTTHGHGLATFRHGAATLLHLISDNEADSKTQSLRAGAAELFDQGQWESIVERTGRKYGLWGIAYLEAVLRAADVQISEEGK